MPVRPLHILLSIAFLISSCSKSEDTFELPLNTPDLIVLFDDLAKEKGLSLTSELTGYTIVRSESCEYSFD